MTQGGRLLRCRRGRLLLLRERLGGADRQGRRGAVPRVPQAQPAEGEDGRRGEATLRRGPVPVGFQVQPGPRPKSLGGRCAGGTGPGAQYESFLIGGQRNNLQCHRRLKRVLSLLTAISARFRERGGVRPK